MHGSYIRQRAFPRVIQRGSPPIFYSVRTIGFHTFKMCTGTQTQCMWPCFYGQWDRQLEKAGFTWKAAAAEQQINCMKIQHVHNAGCAEVIKLHCPTDLTVVTQGTFPSLCSLQSHGDLQTQCALGLLGLTLKEENNAGSSMARRPPFLATTAWTAGSAQAAPVMILLNCPTSKRRTVRQNRRILCKRIYFKHSMVMVM